MNMILAFCLCPFCSILISILERTAVPPYRSVSLFHPSSIAGSISPSDKQQSMIRTVQNTLER